VKPTISLKKIVTLEKLSASMAFPTFNLSAIGLFGQTLIRYYTPESARQMVLTKKDANTMPHKEQNKN